MEASMPNSGQESPNSGQESPNSGQESPNSGQESPNSGQESPNSGQESPNSGQESPKSGQESPKSGQESPNSGQKSPNSGQESPNSGQESPLWAGVAQIWAGVAQIWAGVAQIWAGVAQLWAGVAQLQSQLRTIPHPSSPSSPSPLLHLHRAPIPGFFERQTAGMKASMEERAAELALLKRAGMKASTEERAAELALLKVLPPLFSRWFPGEFGGQGEQVALCYSYELLEATVPTVRAVKGFNFTKDPDSKIPKPGFATWQAGSFADFIFDTSAQNKPALQLDNPSTAQAQLEIRYLVSYERMGVGHVACVEGCECEGGDIDATISQQWSVPEKRVFDVSQSEKCVVRIDVRRGKGEKFKILSFTVMFKPK
ncbi:unnamed protein product [Closterium sp. Naga37s-1]|nr:unnamed protein product [Closterium sp. Naga37s-1]